MTTTTTALSLDEKLAILEDIMRPMERALIGYSGGVDSAMLAVAAQRVLGEGAICVTADSESYASGELERAQEITDRFGIRHEVVKTRELDNPDYAKNAPDRCYYCKQELFSHMERMAVELDVDYILYGQNADDVGDFRPGAKAAREKGVRAPLAEAGLDKADVRSLARRWGISVWDRPAMACLSSRFPYGTAVTADGLKKVDAAEAFLRTELGYAQVRSRHHDFLARIELPSQDLEALLGDGTRCRQTADALQAIGYTHVTVDLRGFRSGSMNEALLSIEASDAPLFERLDPILTRHQLAPAAFEERDQTLYLRLNDPTAMTKSTLRQAVVSDCEALGFRYIALDLQPLSV